MPEFDKGEYEFAKEQESTLTKEQESSLQRFYKIAENENILATFAEKGLEKAFTTGQITDLYEGAKIFLEEDHFDNQEANKLAQAIIESVEK